MPESPSKLHHGVIGWMAGNSVASNLLMIVLLVGGLIYALRIKQEVFPELVLDAVSVSVAYPGASPEEVEQGIVLAIEESIRGLDGIDEVSSNASEGMGIIVAELLLGEDPQKLSRDVQSAVDRITTLPLDAEKPQVTQVTARNHVISLVIYGDQTDAVLREAAEDMRDRLLQDPGITQVELSKTRPLEIGIEIPQARLREYGLTMEQVANRIRLTAIELPGGGVKTRGGEVLIRMTERRDLGREFGTIPIIMRPDGTTLRLGDLAEIKDGFAETDTESTYNGKPCIMLDVYRVGRETPLTVSDTVHEYAETFNTLLPDGLSVASWDDRAEIFRQRINLLLRNAALGLILVLVLLSLFLEMRLAFWVTMGIPISFLGAMLFLPAIGVSINMISLFAFIIALGIVVDDAIVVGENIYDHHQRGMPFQEAAVVGARQVAMPVAFSILTNIAAFLPMFFVPGVMGQIFKVIPAVVVMVFLLSWLESMLILPNHLSHGRDRTHRGLSGWMHHRQQAFSHWFSHIIRDRFGPLLSRVILWRYVTLAVGLMVLLLTVGLIRSGRMGMTMFPKVDSDMVIASAVLPYGSPVAESRRVREHLLTTAREAAREIGFTNQVDATMTTIGKGLADGMGIAFDFGGSGSHKVEVILYLTPTAVRPLPTSAFMKKWRQATGTIAGLETLTFLSDAGGPGSGAALTVEISHRDLGVLETVGNSLAESLRLYPQVADIDSGFSPGKRQLDFRVKPEGLSLGLTPLGVASQVRHAFYGAEVLRQQRGRNEIKVMVRLPKVERASEYNIEELMLRTPSGAEVLLTDVVEIERGRAYTTINRRGGRRVVTVTADVDPPKDAGLILAEVKRGALSELLQTYPGLSYGLEGKQADMRDSVQSLMIGFLFAMMVIYALLAVPFRSYAQPLIVMVSIPFGVVGAVIGHLLMGYSLSLMSIFGIVALSGVVVNDSLILIDYANRKVRNEGLTPLKAIHEAGVRRFRPIMLTTLTTFGGLTPMIFETSMQARFLIPMAISLGFGILFATGITLFIVPSLYLILTDLSRLFGVRNPVD